MESNKYKTVYSIFNDRRKSIEKRIKEDKDLDEKVKERESAIMQFAPYYAIKVSDIKDVCFDKLNNCDQEYINKIARDFMVKDVGKYAYIDFGGSFYFCYEGASCAGWDGENEYCDCGAVMVGWSLSGCKKYIKAEGFYYE
jgi:hypothetical protein